MKTSFELAVEFRDDQGKGASRRLRRTGKVPAIIYGGHEAARALSIDHTKLMQMLDKERFYSTILNLKAGDEQQAAVLKDVQRHPWKSQILHIDFQRVHEDEKIRMRVPLHFANEAASMGVKTQGGMVSHLRNDVEVLCLPKHLPEFIEVDLLNLGLGQLIHLSELVLGEGVELPELIHGNDAPVVSIHAHRAEAVAEVAAAPAAAAVAAAPAAAAKPDAKKPEAKKPEAKK